MHKKKQKEKTRSNPKKFINITDDRSALDEIIMPVEINLNHEVSFILGHL